MQIFLVLAVLIAIVAVVFAVQNIAVVAISFFAWSVDIPLAVALLVSLAVGVVITLLVSIPGRIKGGWNSASNRKKYASLEAERDTLKRKIDQAAVDRDGYLKKWEDSQRAVADLEEELASVSAALQDADQQAGIKALPAAPVPPSLPPASQPTPPADDSAL